MCVQSDYHSPTLRRSPRFVGSNPPAHSKTPDQTSRRLAFESENNENISAPETSPRRAQATRRVQLHPSAEQVSVPASVDVERSNCGPDSFEIAPSADTESPTQNSDIHGFRRVKIHPSVEALSIRASVDLQDGFSDPIASDSANVNDSQPTSQEPTENELCVSQENNVCVSQLRQLHPSAEPVSVPSSVDVRPCNVPSSVQNQSNGSDPVPLSQTANRSDGARQANSPRGAVLDISDEEGTEALSVRATCARDLDGLYTFLLRMTVKNLRGLLKDIKTRQSGKKEVLLARIFVSFDLRFAGGESLTDITESYRITSRFDSWMKHQKELDGRVPQYWTVAPSLTKLLSLLDAMEAQNFKKKRTYILRSSTSSDPGIEAAQQNNASRTEGQIAQRASSSAEPNFFSLNEFARLCIIIRDDEDAKAAFFATGQELTRSQMDAGFSRESFWGVIESRFNDPSLKFHLNMVGNVDDDVDSTLAPPVHRTASFLKDKFFDARSSFTVCVENWSKSGQNSNSNFKNFAGTRGGVLTAAGKRNMVLFVCARMGTENEDSRFRSMCSRVIPSGGGVDEGGSVFREEDEPSYPRRDRISSRRDSSGNSGAENESANRSIVHLSEYIIQRGRQKEQDRRAMHQEKIEERRERRQQLKEQHEELKEIVAERRAGKRKHSEGMKQLENDHKIIRLLRYATETLESRGQDPGTELVDATNVHKQALFKAFQMPKRTPEGLQGSMSFAEEPINETRRDDDSEACRDQIRNCIEALSGVSGIEEDQILPN